MKKILGTMILMLCMYLSYGQNAFNVQGSVIDSLEANPIAGATIQLGRKMTAADGQGHFKFYDIKPGRYLFQVSCIGFATYRTYITMSEQRSTIKTVRLKNLELYLQPLEVKALRAGKKAPFTKQDLDKSYLENNNNGQDLPFILNQTPSIYVSSDAGNGIGYTYMHIRGSDASRINVTINGIPYNDPESESSYLVDIPDMTSSVSSIQIQRGVGTSSNGTGAFGATINLSTNEFRDKAYAESFNNFGSFNSWRNTIKVGTGLINNHFTVDARLSRISSNGYIDRASTYLHSFGLSFGYYDKKASLHFNVFSGKEKTYQAWDGVPEDSLKTNRTYNPAGTEKPGSPYANQTDNFQQDHYQLLYNQDLGKGWTMSTAAFLVIGKGYYEEYKANQSFSTYGLTPIILPAGDTIRKTDLIRQRYDDSHFYGQTFSLQYKAKNDELTFAGGWNHFQNNHYGIIIWAQYSSNMDKDHQYYFYPANKFDENFYVKWQHNFLNGLTFFSDIQFRHVHHDMDGFETEPTGQLNEKFNFLMPKAGFSYSWSDGWNTYLSYAMGKREPSRTDFENGYGTVLPRPETLHDFELGIERKKKNLQLSANVYYMLYKNQLVLTGQINQDGSTIHNNVPNSYRIGIEMQGNLKLTSWSNISANLNLSSNKINSYVQYIDSVDNATNFDALGQATVQHKHTDISFSPKIISGYTLNLLPVKNTILSLSGKYVGSQYMDNSQSARTQLKAFYTQDMKLSWTIRQLVFSEIEISGQILNLFNKKYEPNGYTYAYKVQGSSTIYYQNNYYPMAGTNYMLSMNIKF